MKNKIINSIFLLVFIGGIVELFQKGINAFGVVYSMFLITLSGAILVGARIANAREVARRYYNKTRKSSSIDNNPCAETKRVRKVSSRFI